MGHDGDVDLWFQLMDFCIVCTEFDWENCGTVTKPSMEWSAQNLTLGKSWDGHKAKRGMVTHHVMMILSRT